jgi:hypothetical protein
VAHFALNRIAERLAGIVLLALAVVSLTWWWTTLSRVVGGADSYGYVTESQLILRGSLVQRPPELWRLGLDRSTALAVGAPVGYVPSLSTDGIVPVYPVGLPALMALAALVAGPEGVFHVAPVMGVIGLLLVYAIARVWFDPLTSCLAVAWVAWNPVYIAYARQPMSDVPATALALAAIWLIVRSPAWPLAAGLAAGLAFLTRPALVAAMVGIGAGIGARPHSGIGARGIETARTDGAGNGAWPHFTNYVSRLKELLGYGSFFAVAVLLQMFLHWKLYGHPLQSGYGSPATLFAPGRLPANLHVFGAWTYQVLGALWLASVLSGLWCVRASVPRVGAIVIACGVSAPYLLYFEFDHWETLRFVLLGLVCLTIVAAGGITTCLRRVCPAWLVSAAVIAFGAAFALQSNRWLDHQGTWRLTDAEARYPLAAAWVAQVTPPDAMVLAGQHSGSIRHYANRFTLRWDVLSSEALVPTLRHLNAQGIDVFAAFEGAELERFHERFRNVLHQIDQLPAGQARGVVVVELRVHSS